MTPERRVRIPVRNLVSQGRVGNPVLILRNAVAANIVAVLTQLIEVVGRRFR